MPTFTYYVVRAKKDDPKLTSKQRGHGDWVVGEYLANTGFQNKIDKVKMFPSAGKAKTFLRSSSNVRSYLASEELLPFNGFDDPKSPYYQKSYHPLRGFTDEEFEEYFEIVPAVVTVKD